MMAVACSPAIAIVSANFSRQLCALLRRKHRLRPIRIADIRPYAGFGDCRSFVLPFFNG